MKTTLGCAYARHRYLRAIHLEYLPVEDVMMQLGLFKKPHSSRNSSSECTIMAPLVYNSIDKLGKMKTLTDREVCLCKNSVTVDGHNSLSIFVINIIHTFFVPSRSLSSILLP